MFKKLDASVHKKSYDEDSKTLLSLVEYEKQVFLKWNPLRLHATPSGIECPTCKNGVELMDGTFKYPLNPPKLQVQCQQCDYQGYRTLAPGEV